MLHSGENNKSTSACADRLSSDPLVKLMLIMMVVGLLIVLTIIYLRSIVQQWPMHLDGWLVLIGAGLVLTGAIVNKRIETKWHLKKQKGA